MSKKLPILVLLSLSLAGCEVGHLKLPMTLGPSDAAPASCLSDTTAHGDCKAPAALSGAQETK